MDYLECIRARGGFLVDLEWAGGKLLSGGITSQAGPSLHLVHGNKTLSMPTIAGQTIELGPGLTPDKIPGSN